MKNLHNLTLKDFHEGLLNKEFSALEITQAFFDYIAEEDKKIHAYLTLFKDEAVRQASEVDVALAKSKVLPVLAGAPLAIKDNLLIAGTQTTAASKVLENYQAAYDAAVIEKLKGNQAVFLGKTNLDEFAMGSSTENSAFGPTKNPYDLTRVPGGSSGGSAAAVADHMALAALGSDTGGSIRQPAAFCGVVGLKPTYGAVSRHGLIAMASSLDQVGPITKTVHDAAILFQAIQGKDKFDATSESRDYQELLNPQLKDVQRLKIGLPKEYFDSGLDKTVAAALAEAIKNVKSLKLEFKEIGLPNIKHALSVYYIIMPAEVSTNLARFDGIRYARLPEIEGEIKSLRDIYFKERGMGFGDESRRRILLGTFVLSAGYYDAYYGKAQRVRRLIKEDFDKVFQEVDVILAPTTPTSAFKLGEKTDDPLQMYLSDIFTIPANLAGLPALSLPVKKYDLAGKELPIGFQLIGRPFHEKDILSLGQFYEEINS